MTVTWELLVVDPEVALEPELVVEDVPDEIDSELVDHGGTLTAP